MSVFSGNMADLSWILVRIRQIFVKIRQILVWFRQILVEFSIFYNITRWGKSSRTRLNKTHTTKELSAILPVRELCPHPVVEVWLFRGNLNILVYNSEKIKSFKNLIWSWPSVCVTIEVGWYSAEKEEGLCITKQC